MHALLDSHHRLMVTVGMQLCNVADCKSLGADVQVADVAAAAQKSLSAAITGPSIALLESCPDDLWPRLARLLASALRNATQVSPFARHLVLSMCAKCFGAPARLHSRTQNAFVELPM